MTQRYLVHADDRTLFRVSGEDNRTFLQGLVSNDVEPLQPSRAVYAALLTPQGKFLHDFMLFDAGDGSILIDVATSGADDLLRRLTLYRLRAKVGIERLDDHVVLLSFGSGEPYRPKGFDVFDDPRHPLMGSRLAGRREDLPRDLDDPDRYDLHRLRLGIPDGGLDLVQERSTLAEAGFEELGGVSFTKGCYVGQELTARMKHRGLAKRRLMPVAIDGMPPACGTVLDLDGREALEMRSSRDGLGMALVRLDRVENIEAGGVACENGIIRLRRPDGAGA
ncbi:MAG: folate-binding protein YgfZ [Geminicoccaceae bacterium]|nr:folate-binding protein YgfZ [Geminicoccaceae bacterium]